MKSIEGEPGRLGKLRQGFSHSAKAVSLAAVVVSSSPFYTEHIAPADPPLVAPFHEDLGSVHVEAAPVKPPGLDRYTVTLPNLAADGDSIPPISPQVEAESLSPTEETPLDDLNNILQKVQANPDLHTIFQMGLTQQDFIDDLTIYYNICKAAEIAYNIPRWTTIAILEFESAASRSTTDDLYNGAMQITATYSENYIRGAFYDVGLDPIYLTLKKYRHEGDPEMIAAAAKIIHDSMRAGKSLPEALRSYGGSNWYFRLGVIEQLQAALGD